MNAILIHLPAETGFDRRARRDHPQRHWLYGYGLAYYALDREPPAVDIWPNSLDHHSVPTFRDWHH
jgi:hypothetical protein